MADINNTVRLFRTAVFGVWHLIESSHRGWRSSLFSSNDELVRSHRHYPLGIGHEFQ